MIKNAKTLPQIYYGLHMVEGVAEYHDPGVDPYRIYLSEETLKKMDSTFAGKPVYVDHVDQVNLDDLQNEADGYVISSFYNPADGKHWVRFIVVSDRGHEAIRSGWKLSNAYVPKAFSGGGLCHGVEYLKEVTMAEYEHLAIVQNPRYEESIILTPEKFKAYNDDKEAELLKVANSKKGEEKMKFNIFKRAKVENAADIENMSVTLPKSKVDKTLAECIEVADTVQNMNGYANGDHMVKVGEDEMSVNELVEKHLEMKKNMEEEEEKKKNAEEEEKHNDDDDSDMKHNDDESEEEKKENDDESEEEKEEKAVKEKKNKKKKNEDKEGDLQKKPASEEGLAMEKKKDAKKNDDEEKEEKKKNALHFEALKNAPMTAIKDVPKFEMSEDKVARGKAKYGSN